jgi:2-C-methyl-D-erythritol 4-phosphate cytidylyltransferase
MARGNGGAGLDTSVIVLAAGKGTRFRGERKKQYHLLAGCPVLIHAARVFGECPSVKEIVVTAPAGETGLVTAMLEEWAVPKVSAVVEGGESRTASVERGFAVCNPACRVVAVHDAARPLVSAAEAERVIGEARQYGAAVLAVPVHDTIKRVKGNRILETLDRSSLWAAQTPQAFHREILWQAFRQARQMTEEARDSVTDDASLVEILGVPVRVVPGSRRNIKITEEEDLAIAEAIWEGDRNHV